MTTPTIPADAIWGVQWEAPVVPDGEMPDQPAQPAADADPEDWATYNTEMAQWYAALLELVTAHQEWWRELVSTFPSEEVARKMLPDMIATHNGTPFCRNTTLVWSAPTVWTPAE